MVYESDVLGVVSPYARCAGAEEALRRPPLWKDDPCTGRGGEPLEVMWFQWQEEWVPVGSAHGEQCFSIGAVLSPREHWQCPGKLLVSQLCRGQGKIVASSA